MQENQTITTFNTKNNYDLLDGDTIVINGVTFNAISKVCSDESQERKPSDLAIGLKVAIEDYIERKDVGYEKLLGMNININPLNPAELLFTNKEEDNNHIEETQDSGINFQIDRECSDTININIVSPTIAEIFNESSNYRPNLESRLKMLDEIDETSLSDFLKEAYAEMHKIFERQLEIKNLVKEGGIMEDLIKEFDNLETEIGLITMKIFNGCNKSSTNPEILTPAAKAYLEENLAELVKEIDGAKTSQVALAGGVPSLDADY
ncbi:MAG: hypothetical protein K0R02_522 [Rickettsiaceae bacterium]|nr:hypothetical protein [Rickettsiaceae bacterium]